MVRIRAFRAIDDVDSCRKYAQGHENVLRSYNIPVVTSANTDWFYNPNVFVLSVEIAETQQVIGGTKIHVATDLTSVLPFEDALGDMDTKISQLMLPYKLNGTGELCGLWNSKEAAGLGYSVLLTEAGVAEAGIAFAKQLKLKSLFVLCAPWTVKMTQQAGFTIEESLGNKGTFPYPKPDLLATLLVIKDLERLDNADAIERERIFDLRKNPRQRKTEKGPKGDLDIEYDLLISSEVLA